MAGLMGTVTYLWLRRAERDARARIADRRANTGQRWLIEGDERLHKRQGDRAACGAEGVLTMTTMYDHRLCPGCHR